MKTALEIALTKNKNISIVEADLVLALDEVEVVIRNYCNFTSSQVLPEMIRYTWANMALELAEYQYEKFHVVDADEEPVIEASDIGALKIGDTQVTIKAGSGSSTRSKTLGSHSANLDQIVLNYQSQLNQFRRLVW